MKSWLALALVLALVLVCGCAAPSNKPPAAVAPAPAAPPASAAAHAAETKLSPEQIRMHDEQALKFLEQKEYRKALDEYQAVLSSDPNDPSRLYNMACAYSRLNEKEQAVAFLKKAVEAGFSDFAWMETDPDLNAIRDTAGYKELPKTKKSPQALYSDAQALAKAGDKDAALDALQKAVERGWAYPDYIAANAAFAAFKDDPRFQKIVGEIAEAAALKPCKFGLPENLQAGAKAPLIVGLHGAGDNAPRFFGAVGPFLNRSGYAVLVPPASGVTWNIGIDHDRVAAAIRGAIRQLPVDPDRVYVFGFSDGTQMMYRTVFLHSELFAGAVGFSSFCDHADGALVKKAAARVPVVHVHGRRDGVIRFFRGQNTVDYLTQNGFRVKMVAFDGGHCWPPDVAAVILASLRWIDAQREEAQKKQ